MKIKKLITVQDGDNLQRYFQEVKNYEALSKEEEKALIILIQRDNSAVALNKLIKANLKFVISVAKHYQGQGVNLSDLISEGNSGLIEAAYRFDIKKDHKFFSYAVWWIRIMIFTTLDLHKRTIQIPQNRVMLVTRVKKEILELEQTLTRYPTIEELEAHFKKKYKKEKKDNPPTIEDLEEAISFGVKSKSINEKLGDEDEDTLEQLLPSDGSLDTDADQREDSIVQDLNRFLFQLTQPEYDVMVLALGLNKEPIKNNADIASFLSMKEKEIVKYRIKAIKRLRKLKNIAFLKDYLA